jgi:hypothetical protein
MGLNERVVAALAVADHIGARHRSGGLVIPPEDLAIIAKYEDLGMIKLMVKKPRLQEGIYFPIIQAKELKDFSMSFYLRLVHGICAKHGIKTNIGMNSVREYCNKPYEYGFIQPVILPDSEVGNRAQIEEECTILKELLDQA